MTKLSPKFVEALRMKHGQMYRLAFRAGLHPTTLSKVLNGAQEVQPKDKRLVRLGHLLGLSPEELFLQEYRGQR
ncbi:MAG: helix-turn-helix transcriptional regulator [Candidatus Omnitrophica bacterium]|nr:helix-turn-helix transcriptional regulator [Candidatus Omnitrophota bacterium]